MIVVNVKIKKIEVANFSLKTGPEVDFNIYFNDGKEKMMQKKFVLDNPETIAEQVINEIRQIEKKAHKSQGDDILDVVVIRLEDEDEIPKKLMGFFSKVKEKIGYVKGIRIAQGYLGAIESIKKLKAEF
jgi:hypothetical protein